MATTPEGAVKKAARKIIDASGAFSFMPVSNGMGRMGIPDIIGVLHGRFLAVELKAGKGKPTLLQLKALRQIDEAGGLALIINETNLDYLQGCLCDVRQARSNYKLFERPQETLD
jgi:hypothetical protein